MDEEIQNALSAFPFQYGDSEWPKFVKKEKISLPFPVIHVSGSSGKSSVCRFLEGIDQEAGYKVAVFSDYRLLPGQYGIRYDAHSIEEGDFCRIFESKKKLFAKFSLAWNEILCAVALSYFAEKKPDLVILEAGIGGQFDPTNLEDLNTVLAIVTSGGLDHTDVLGTTSSEIALDCAGILKPGCPLLIGSMDENSKSALLDFAKSLGSKLQEADAYHFAHLENGFFHFDYTPYKDLVLPSKASFFLPDACLALEGVRLIQESFPVEEEDIRKGVLDFHLDGRGESLDGFLLCGASNDESTRALASSLPALSGGKPVHVLYASKIGQNIALMLPVLANASSSINLTGCPLPDFRAKEDYFLYEEDYPYIEDPLLGGKGLKERFPDDCIAFAGDLDFVLWVRSQLE